MGSTTRTGSAETFLQWYQQQPKPGNMMIWWFPEIGVPPNHPFTDGFSIRNNPSWGTLIFLETSIWIFAGSELLSH
jgi:hypothetical protein